MTPPVSHLAEISQPVTLEENKRSLFPPSEIVEQKFAVEALDPSCPSTGRVMSFLRQEQGYGQHPKAFVHKSLCERM